MFLRKIFRKSLIFGIIGLILSINLIFIVKDVITIEDLDSNSSNDLDNEPILEGLSMADVELPDKVYTFTVGGAPWQFDLYLNKDYIYYTWIELVTPHNVTKLTIELWDDDNDYFKIFESEMFYSPADGRSFEIPFGTEHSGDYTIIFTAITTMNFNLYISMVTGPKCLYDKLSQEEIDSLEFYDIRKFNDARTWHSEKDVELETDEMYKLYIGRVSAISEDQSPNVYVSYIIEDPNNIEFIIMTNHLILDISGIKSFIFGTSVEGIYKLKVDISCSVPNVNIGMSVSDDYQISEIEEPNQTEYTPPPKEEKEDAKVFIDDLEESINSLPIEFTSGSLILVGCVSIILMIILIQNKRKNSLDFKLKDSIIK